MYNIDWPSKSGLPAGQQKSELIRILDRAAQLKLNAIILQIRPSCDALYHSRIEPWSEFLTGQMGRAPEPFYDPLSFAVDEAHKRGIELHAWFNPYRAHLSGKGISSNHVSRLHPRLVRQHGRFLWLDPGEKAVQDYVLSVVMDVVRRYDIDGVHFDDYFYPADSANFGDNAPWQQYVRAGGKLDRDDWRRENVNLLIQRTYTAIKAEKRWVKFGVSPAGIWRPGHPPQIKGRDNYQVIYADSRKWFANGWLDYFSPQLYWAIDPPQQSYPVLLKWWSEQNAKGRHLWIGNSTSNLGEKWQANEILNQLRLTRNHPGATGNIHYSMKPLMQNRGGISDALQSGLYARPALVPASPWLSNAPVAKPNLSFRRQTSGTTLVWQPAERQNAWQWVLQTRANGQWKTEIFPGSKTTHQFPGANAMPDVVALTAVNRYGTASEPVVYEIRN